MLRLSTATIPFCVPVFVVLGIRLIAVTKHLIKQLKEELYFGLKCGRCRLSSQERQHRRSRRQLLTSYPYLGSREWQNVCPLLLLSDSLCILSWPGMHRDLSTFQVLALKAWTTTPSWMFLLFDFMRQSLSSDPDWPWICIAANCCLHPSS